MRTALGAAALALAVGASGCAYYNGMYNARRAARDAERLEQQGRSAEARDRWQRAAVHAESLVARHPTSRWADDALLIRGRALLQVDFPSDAAVVLEQAARRVAAPEMRAEALTLLGRANLALGRLETARAVLDTAVALEVPRWRGEARLLRGRVYLALARPERALADFAATEDRRGAFDVVRAHLALGDADAAGARLATLVREQPYREADWRGPLDSLGRSGGATVVGRLVDELVSREDLTRGQRARLLVDEGDRRLAALDSVAARARYERCQVAAPDSAESRLAAVRLLRLALAAATSDSDLVLAAERLAPLEGDGGAPGREARLVQELLVRLDSLAEAETAPDAHWFARAELLRDSLRAGRLAARAFAEMATRFPASPWTPKGLVAAIAAGAPEPEAVRALLDARYANSPYRLAALGLAGAGAEADAYRALEDSLARLLPQGEGPRRQVPRRVVRDAEVRDDAPRPAARPPAPRPTSPAAPPPAAGEEHR